MAGAIHFLTRSQDLVGFKGIVEHEDTEERERIVD
jgi:hypothetical protein